MRPLNKLLMTAVFTALAAGMSFAQTPGNDLSTTAQERVITFRFVAGEDMFYIPWEGNNVQLDALYALVDQYRAEITSGEMPVYVDGYSSSMKSDERNHELAFTRANRVKSELILHKGLVEDNFITKNYITTYTGPDGVTYKDMVVVTLRIPTRAEPDNAQLERERREREAAEQERREQADRDRAERERAERDRADAARAAREQAERTAAEQAERDRLAALAAANAKPYCFALRTNLLYDAFLLPTLGVEWRASRHVGIKLDYSGSWWGDEKGKVQKVWVLSPEVRWYLTPKKKFYVGVGGNYSEYNTYGYLLGKLWSDDTGYQGSLWSVGAVVGYQLNLSRSFAIDFNLGLGYLKSEYDSFNMINETRVSNKQDQSKDFWGPTQAGVSLVWKLGRP